MAPDFGTAAPTGSTSETRKGLIDQALFVRLHVGISPFAHDITPEYDRVIFSLYVLNLILILGLWALLAWGKRREAFRSGLDLSPQLITQWLSLGLLFWVFQLAYESDESGRPEVYVQQYPGPGGKWQISNEGGGRPVWSRDGRQLFYRHEDKLMAVPIKTQPNFSAGGPRLLFQGTYFESYHYYERLS